MCKDKENFGENSHICQSMYIFKHSGDLLDYLSNNIAKNKNIGFVPTMGALHGGHIALVKEAKDRNDIVVCSIFVNPTQFNDRNDFDNYPSTIEDDILCLEKAETNILFLPGVDEVYPNGLTASKKYDFGGLDNVLEGQYRPGHFNGVAQVVERLLDLVKPDNLYMGQKDYQQVLIVKKMLEQYDKKINLIACPTVREKNGLAMSSRNARLSEEGKKNAARIYEILRNTQAMISKQSIAETKVWATHQLGEIPQAKLEYLEFVNAASLKTVENIGDAEKILICVACFIEGVRLIDNLIV